MCTYCAPLTVRLGTRASRAVWVNIWKDPAAAAFVRGVNDGDETVPTVVVAGSTLTNPPPGLVFRALA
jgi:mycoredoxin